MGKVKKVVIKKIDKNLVKPIQKYKVNLKNARKPSKVTATSDLNSIHDELVGTKTNKIKATSDNHLSFTEFIENFVEPIENKLILNEAKSSESKIAPTIKKTAKVDDKKFDLLTALDENTVRSGIEGLFNIIQKNKDEKGLFDDEEAIFLQFSAIKIGKTPSRILRMSLKHSLLKESGEICLIIPDTKGKSPKEYEKTIEKCEELLKKEGVNNIKTIMTYYQLRTDYGEYELQRKLVELYDLFLVDGKIASYVEKKLGKIFRNKRKAPIPIRFDDKNLDGQIKFALLKTSTNLHGRGDNFVIQVGHSDMSKEQIYENILEVCGHLNTCFPGGWNNVRGLNLKTAKSTSLPIYYTLKNSNNVLVPKIKATRPKAFKAVSGELSTAYDRTVTVLPSGLVKVHPKENGKNINKNADDNLESEEVTDTEEVQSNTEKLTETKKRKTTQAVIENSEDEHMTNNKDKTILKKLKENKKLKTQKLAQKRIAIVENGEDEDMTNNKDSKQSKEDKAILQKVKKLKEHKKLKIQKLAQKRTKIVENGGNETSESVNKKQLKKKHLENSIKKSKKVECEPLSLEQLLTKNLDSIFGNNKKSKRPSGPIKKNSKKRIVRKMTK